MNKYSWLIALTLSSLSASIQAEEHLRLATTTSTQDSGLLEVLHPALEAELQVKIDVIAVGSGKALKLGENGDIDVLLVHDPAAEEKFIAAGFGVERQPVMHNDFVLLGPATDPAGVKQSDNLADAMKKIAGTSSFFISRGDESGTHQKELQLWRAAGVEPAGKWYLAVGQGMGAVLKIANDKLAYTLADRGTYLAFRDKIELVIVFAGIPELFNPYHVILVNPEKHPHVKYDLAKRYADFIRGKEGQKIIREFKIGGEQLFYPDVLTQ
ncbi:MAG: Tungsten ABC transporter substrate-binding protein [Gammaproteobacteria bacterium]|nr:Tungsten ABC transporter substrate-binding protein [Gammaproteobacteria bacterium]